MDPRLVEIVNELLAIVRAVPQDVSWQDWYDDEDVLVEDLRDHAERLRRGDGSRLPELKFVLLPTGALNEIAFSSGWGEPYVRLANEFDHIYGLSSPAREPDLRTGQQGRPSQSESAGVSPDQRDSEH
jgi:hypothetical protein